MNSVQLILFVAIINVTRWSSNLSPGHSNFPLGIICGRQWRSLAVEDHLRSILGIICDLGIIYGTVQLYTIPYLLD